MRKKGPWSHYTEVYCHPTDCSKFLKCTKANSVNMCKWIQIMRVITLHFISSCAQWSSACVRRSWSCCCTALCRLIVCSQQKNRWICFLICLMLQTGNSWCLQMQGELAFVVFFKKKSSKGLKTLTCGKSSAICKVSHFQMVKLICNKNRNAEWGTNRWMKMVVNWSHLRVWENDKLVLISNLLFKFNIKNTAI